MHRLAPALLALALTACSVVDSIESHLGLGDSDSCGATCKATEKKFGLEERTVHDSKEKTFTSGGTEYTLVRLEYGKTEECDPLGDCAYSTYCGFRVGDHDFPLEVNWVTDEDQLFDPAEYCDGGELAGCELPGQALPILDDPDFEDWIYTTDPDEDVLADCFADYW